MSAVPSWAERYKSLCVKCGGGLALMGLDGIEIGVYIYLFHRLLVYNGSSDSASSAPSIEAELNSIMCYLPGEYRKNYTPSAVGTAVKKLVSMGLVEEASASRARKSAGRPAKTYKAVTVGAARKAVEKTLDDYKEEILRSFGPLEQLEEGRSMEDDRLSEADRQ